MLESLVSKRDYYDILGIPKSASEDDINSAFRKLARQYHPDVTQEEDKEKAEEKFKEANEAHGVLSDENKRARYDTFGHSMGETTAPQPQQQTKTEGNGRAKTRPQPDGGLNDLIAGLDMNNLFGMGQGNDIFSQIFSFGSQPVGKDGEGWFFAIPSEDIKLLAAMYRLRMEAQDGNKGMVYDTGVYRVSLEESGNCRVMVRPRHWKNEPGEIRTGSLSGDKLIDPDIPINHEDVSYGWRGINKPSGFSYYLNAVDVLSKKLTMTGQVNAEREQTTICNFGLDQSIVRRFDSRRIGYDEIHDTVRNYGANFRDIGKETGGEKTTR